jgi:hypothetical protein
MPEKQRFTILKLSLNLLDRTVFIVQLDSYYSRTSAINFQNKKRAQQKQQPKINLLTKLENPY